ncbi:MAG: hypothetical protein ACRD8O_00080, partial [Bryobacteraceae bacterium]
EPHHTVKTASCRYLEALSAGGHSGFGILPGRFQEESETTTILTGGMQLFFKNILSLVDFANACSTCR